MDNVTELVDSIQRICEGQLTEEQLLLITNLLSNSNWFPNKHDHIYLFKLYKEMKLETEAELRIFEEKANMDPMFQPRVDKLSRFLEQLEKAINNYTNAFTFLMNSYGNDKGKAFYLFYFKGCDAKDVARELPWLAIGTINNWKSQFQKELSKIKIELN